MTFLIRLSALTMRNGKTIINTYVKIHNMLRVVVVVGIQLRRLRAPYHVSGRTIFKPYELLNGSLSLQCARTRER